jgi:sulfatase maturation enzyme AslB (radical SAM superfamily)
MSADAKGFYNTANWPPKSDYYRWPWSSNDNPVLWLEVTDLCNIRCKGCYRSRIEGHRPLSVLEEEVDFCIRNRNIDTVCIAGGEPLIYPDIVELVRYIAGRGLKANIITNTQAMTEELVRDLWKAGVFGFTCHIDMVQERPNQPKAASELELMPRRQRIADLLYRVGHGKIYCTFNSTVYHENFKYIPDIVRWMHANADKVSGLDFITYRGIPLAENVKWDVETEQNIGHEEIHTTLGYAELDVAAIDITSVDVYNLLKDNFGELFEPCAYLGGTGDIKQYKWWGQVFIMEKNGTCHGSLGPRLMELMQIAHHWFRGKYFMYLRGNRAPRILILLTALIGDRKMRKGRRSILRGLVNPLSWFRMLRFQSIGINQPPDMLENGMPCMCESCPDATVWQGNLVSSCRLDEYRKYGKLMSAIVRDDNVATVGAPDAAVTK